VTDPLHFSATATPRTTNQTAKQTALREAAQSLEAGFLTEMLKSARVGELDNSLSGSAGENHFASFQREALARDMVRSGGIGLTEIILKSLMENNNAR
jgi:Rod binding domain-containing protein